MPTTMKPITDDHAKRRDLILFGRRSRPERVKAEERSRPGDFGTIKEVVVTSHTRPTGANYEHLSFVTRFGNN